MGDIPGQLRFSKKHLWAHVDGDRARIGLAEFAQDQLGDIVLVEVPPVGRAITAGEPFGVAESNKGITDLIAPLSGEVLETNGELKNAPSLVNEDPYGRGWLLVIRVSSTAEVDALMEAQPYRLYVEMASA
jgi:glycine cleavage system H protein